MTLTEIPRAEEDDLPWLKAGTWAPANQPSGDQTAVVGCPGCGVRSYMSDHEIDDEGRVTPSVGCPVDCGYHEVGVVLLGWRESWEEK